MNLRSFENLFLTYWLQRTALLGALRSCTNSRDPEVKGMEELELIIISNGNRTEWSSIQGVIGGVILNQPSAI